MKRAKYSFIVCAVASVVVGATGNWFLFETYVIPGKDATIQNLQTKPNQTTSVSNEINGQAFNTELAQKYEDRFNSDFMVRQRIRASKALLEFLTSTNKNWDSLTNGTGALDYVLGFFDELGYDESLGKINPEVAHEYFYADVRGYAQAAEQYIAYSQQTDSSDDFEYVKPLLDSVTEVESKKTGTSASAQVWSDNDMTIYLKDEIDVRR